MLLRRDSTYIDEATKQARRIFPDGTAWLYFQSRLPAPEVFKNTVLDGAIGVAGSASRPSRCGRSRGSAGPGENVGEFYSATNKLISNVLDLAARPGPLLYTIDAVKVRDAWKLTFENFWEFMRAEWHRYKGWGWGGLLSRLSTLMVAFEDKGALRLGGRFPAMPVSLIPNVREQPDFSIGFEHSIFSRVIEPFCVRLGQLQHYYLNTTEVAYIPPGAGALYTSEGQLKKSKLALEF